MEVRRDSWHYKLYKFGHGGSFPPGTTNLCKYFWGAFWGLFMGAFFTSVLSFIVYVIGYVFYHHTGTSFTVLGVLVALGLSIYLRYRVKSRRRDRRVEEGHYGEPEPGLLRLYLKAKKEKACPFITFVDAPVPQEEK